MKEIFSKYKYRIVMVGIAIVATVIVLLIGNTYGNNEINGIRYALTEEGSKTVYLNL